MGTVWIQQFPGLFVPLTGWWARAQLQTRHCLCHLLPCHPPWHSHKAGLSGLNPFYEQAFLFPVKRQKWAVTGSSCLRYRILQMQEQCRHRVKGCTLIADKSRVVHAVPIMKIIIPLFWHSLSLRDTGRAAMALCHTSQEFAEDFRFQALNTWLNTTNDTPSFEQTILFPLCLPVFQILQEKFLVACSKWYNVIQLFTEAGKKQLLCNKINYYERPKINILMRYF